MKKLSLIIAFALMSFGAMKAEVLSNEELVLGSGWVEFKQLLVSTTPVLAGAQAGDVIAITVSEAANDAQLVLQNTSWTNLGDEYAKGISTAGVYAFALTEAAAAEVSTNGFIVKGINYTLTKIELLYQQTLWEGNLVATTSWEQTDALSNALFADLQAGDLLGVTVSELHPGDWHLYALRTNWTTNVIEHNMSAAGTGIDMLTTDIVTSLQNDPVILVGSYLTATAIHTYVPTKGVQPAGENETIWTGEKDFGGSWSAWEQIAASKFANAVEGQLLRFRFKDLRAGAQLKVGRSDWEVMDDTEIVNLSGRYQDFTITAKMLAELQANGTIISGLGFTLTEVQLLDPASLKTLTLSVPVTDNWVFAARPTLTIHVENPYDEAVTANAEVEIATDKMAAVTTLKKSVEVAAKAAQDIVLTTDADLAAGFYKATCIVNDDLARAFVFGINPTAIVSAPDKQSDFDAFWAAAKQQLADINMNATLTEITAKSTAARKVYLVEMNSVPDGLTGEPVVVRGYYCEPQDGQQHPVIMHYMGYDSGYRPGGQDVKPYCPSGDAEPNYAEFYLSTRGQSINNRAADEREADGKGDFVNTYGDWFAFNFGNKDSYYYRGAFIDCVQAIRFMATRSTSDMNNLFAEGQSQGGAFTYAAASLSDYPMRAIAPGIAFLGDYPDYFDITNWPAYVARENQGTLTDAEMFAFLSYFDTKNLATAISCPTIACIGLQDNVCPPHTNIAPYNNLLSTDKQLIFNPENAHQAGSTWYSDMMAFFAARIDNTTTGATDIEHQPILADKHLRNGQLIIVRNNQMYNALGQQL